MTLSPGDDYRRQRSGQPDGRFETDARIYQSPDLLLAIVGDFPTRPTSASFALEVTKPDPRLSLEVQIGFDPTGSYAGVTTDTLTTYGATVGQGLALSTIWLALLGDFRSGVRETENVIGTKALPEQLIGLGLWGATYEVDVDVIGIRCALGLVSPGVHGRWMAVARWTGTEDISQRDWEHLRQKMQAFRTPRETDQMQFEEPT